MYRSALRATPRAAHALRPTAIRAVPRRFASTSPADKKRSWKSWSVRWGLAVGALYWYNTSPAFAEELQPSHVNPPPQFSDEDLPTIEAVVEQKRREAEARLAKAAAEKPQEEATATTPGTEPPAAQDDEQPAVGGPEELEAEAGQQGAFNPETGEINWDCPCLGGMANGPCGEEFKAAFSCFVYSKEEPKGMDCIDKFQHMQDCFRQHPEVYGDELPDEEEEGQAPGEAVPEAADAQTAPTESAAAVPSTTAPVADSKADVKPAPTESAAAAPPTTAPVANGKVDVKPTAANEALPAPSAEVAKPPSKDA